MSTEVEQLWLSLSTLQAAFDSAVRELRAVAIAAKETAEERDGRRWSGCSFTTPTNCGRW